jgi:hypothetical protein
VEMTFAIAMIPSSQLVSGRVCGYGLRGRRWT